MGKYNRMTMTFTRMRDSLDPLKNKRTILIDTIGSGFMFGFFSVAILLGMEKEAAIAFGDVISHNDYVITYGISAFMSAVGTAFGYVAGRYDVRRGIEEASRNRRIFEEAVRSEERRINGRNLPDTLSFNLESVAVEKVLVNKNGTIGKGEFIAIPVQHGFMTDCVTGVISLEKNKKGNPFGYRYDPIKPKEAGFDVQVDTVQTSKIIEQRGPVRKRVPR